MNMPLVLLNRRRRGFTAFSPSTLFALAEPGVWYDPSDLTTLYQDPAGTTPVTAPGNTVGLMLDKSRALALGAELVANGTFDSGIADWTKGAGTTDPISWDSVGQRIKVTNDIAYYGGGFQTLSSLVVGKSYLVTATISGNTVDARVSISFMDGATSLTFPPGGGNARFVFTATSTSHSLVISNNQNTLGGISYWDNISVRELPGNHATQATITARPTYSIEPVGGRRNLLLQTEAFDTATWLKNALTVGTTSTASPDGTTTAKSLTEGSGTIQPVIYQGVSSIAGTFSVYVKANGRNFVQIVNSGAYANFDLSAGTVGSVAGFTNADITPDGPTAGWYRISATIPSSTVVGVVLIASSTATYRQSYTGDGTSGILIWGAQLELGSTATPYQRVTTQHDVTEAGVASVGYLYFDGASDNMVTSTITPGTDKAQVFAGVRKLRDSPIGMIAELSATGDGSFYVLAGSDVGGVYSSLSRGSAAAAVGQIAITTAGAAPDQAVLTTTHDIAGDLSVIRRNAVAGTSGTADKGTGNFLAYPLYIGRRNGASLEFNGHLYSLITRFGPTLDAPTITSTETWVAGKTGIVI